MQLRSFGRLRVIKRIEGVGYNIAILATYGGGVVKIRFATWEDMVDVRAREWRELW